LGQPNGTGICSAVCWILFLILCVLKLQHNDKVTFIAKFFCHLTQILQNYLLKQALRYPYECNLFIYVYAVFMYQFLRWSLWRKEEASWNVMTHAQKPDFVFRRNGRVHLNRRGRQFSRLLTAEVCASAVVMLDTPCSEVVGRGYPLHSPVSPSLPLPCVTVCHHVSARV
jgi:hypothetical protein